MKLAWDETKRIHTLADRGLEFADADLVFAGPTFEFLDARQDYGEERTICVGFLRGRMIVLVYVQHGVTRRIVSMRKANDREQRTYQTRLAGP